MTKGQIKITFRSITFRMMFRIYEILGLSYKRSYDTVIQKGHLFILQNSLSIEYSWCKDEFGRHYKKKEKVKRKQI